MTVLVTGGTVRLGRAIAERLRHDGWRVLTSSHRPDAGADIVADLSEPLGAARLYTETLRLLGGEPPDALVNNAALFTGDPARIRAVGFDAPQKLTMLMAGRETGRGTVVNVLDCAVLTEDATSPASDPARAAYRRAKADLSAYTRKAALMFAETLRVNGVAPGPVLAPEGVHVAAGETLLGRPGSEDVAEAVAYLLKARATTGAILPVDGGQTLLEGRWDDGIMVK